MSMLFKRIKDWAVSITSFRTGDVLPVDGPSGTAKMPYSDLAKEVIKDSANNTAATEADLVAASKMPIITANGLKALPGDTITPRTYAHNVAASIAPPFVPNTTNAKAGKPYTYDGVLYIANEDYNGTWNPSKFTSVSVDDLLRLEKAFHSAAAGNCIGCFPTANGGNVSLVYKQQGGGVDNVGFILVSKVGNYHATACVISNNPDNCPLSVLFDGTRLIIKNVSNASVDYNIASFSTNFVEQSALPAGWDADSAQEVSPFKISPVDLSSYATHDELVATTTVPSGGYLGYSTITGYNGAICVFWRYAGASGVTSGFFMFSKYSSTVNQTCICDTAGKCPFEVLVDGTRLVVKNKLAINVYAKVVSKYEQFVVENALPPSWDSESAAVVTTLTEINHVDTSSFVNASTYLDTWGVSAGKLVGYAPDANGGGIFIAYRYSGSPKGTATGYAMITRTAGTVQAVNISERSDGWPFKLLWDGTRFAIQNGLLQSIGVRILAKFHSFVVSTEFPSNWNSANQQEVGKNVYQINRTDNISPNSFNVNRSQIKYLTAISRYRKAGLSAQDFCAMIVTDSHGDWKSVDNARVCSDNFAPIQMLIHCGDVGNTIVRGTESLSEWSDIVASATKPVLFVVGNHEAGNYFNIGRTPTDENLYKMFIKPIVDKGFLANGTYTENKLYYYKDFSGAKTRVIVLDEYEAPQDVDTTYWEPVTYDASYPLIENNTDYTVGDKVNVDGYTTYSFEAKSSFNSGTFYSGYQPKFKIRRGYRFISQAQAEWLISTLNSVPTGYSVMICMHQVFSDSVTKVESKFTQTDWNSSPTAQNVMATDLVALILKNFVAKTDQTISVSFSGEAAYVSGYSVDANFASNTKELKNICIVGGHYHRDVVVKNGDNVHQVLATTSNTTSQPNYEGSDIERPSTASSHDGVDCLTCVALRDTGETGLCKIGNNLTYYGTLRDFEIVTTLS